VSRRLDPLAPESDHFVVPARLVQRVQRPPDLPADRFVGLPGNAADQNDRRPRLFRERSPSHTGRNEDERACGGVDSFTVELEPCPPTVDQVEVLIRVVLEPLRSQMTRLALQRIVLLEDPVADVPAGPCAHAEGRDAEVLTDRPPWRAVLAGLVDV